MTSGISFIRNGVALDYPFIESIRSALPLCDEFVIAVGKSDDDTRERIMAINDPRLRIVDTIWDESLRTGGAVLAQQTNIALDAAKGDWILYLQGDEVVHEQDHATILAAMREHLNDSRVEGLLFNYKHFYGSYNYVGTSRQWYRREIRIVRNRIGVRSWGDAQGFRIGTRKLNVLPIDATIFHYGWVKPPEIQQRKQRTFNKLWHPDDWVEEHVGSSPVYEYAGGGKLSKFEEEHPAVMRDRIAHANWEFTYDPARHRPPLNDAILDWLEARTGWRIGEYRNYRVVKR